MTQFHYNKVTKTCKNCERKFETQHATRKYCSTKCRREYLKKKNTTNRTNPRNTGSIWWNNPTTQKTLKKRLK